MGGDGFFREQENAGIGGGIKEGRRREGGGKKERGECQDWRREGRGKDEGSWRKGGGKPKE